jgi:hypothetical protein
VVSFTPRTLYPHGKSSLYQLDRRLSGPQSWYGHGGEEKNSQLLPGLGPPIIQPVAQRFFKSNLSISNFYLARLLTEILSLSFATIRQWSVSQSAPLKERTSNNNNIIYLNVVFCLSRHDLIMIMIMCDTIRRSSSVFMNVAVWECALDN